MNHKYLSLVKGLLNLKILFISLSVMFLVIFSFFPLFNVFFKSAFLEGELTLINYKLAFTDDRNFIPLLNTLKISTGSMIIGILIAVPLAWLVARTDLPNRGTFKFLFLIPFIIPPYIGAIAWIILANPYTGYLNKIFFFIFNIKYLFNIYTIWGVIWVMGLFFYPLVFMPTYAILEKMDSSLEESAHISGASNLKVIRDITIPLAMPGILSGALLVFVASAASFGVPAMVGMPGRVIVTTTKILEHIYLFSEEGMNQAVSMSVILMIIALAILSFNTWFLRKREYTVIVGKSTQPHIIELGKYRTSIHIACWGFITLVGFLPLIAIISTSLLKIWGVPFGVDNISLINYKNIIFKEIDFRKAFMNSFFLGITVATAGSMLAAIIAYIKIKTRISGRDLLDSMATIPYAIPGMIIGLSFILTWSGRFYINIYNTYIILFLAYLIKYLSFPLRTITAALEQVDDSLEESSWICGAPWVQTFKRILYPLIRGSIFAGWVLLFLVVFSELTLSLLLYGPKTTTIGVLLYEYQVYEDPVLAATLSCIIVFVIFLANFTLKKISKGRYGI